MTTLNFLCVDIGTTSLKAALIDSEGDEAAFTRVAYGANIVTAQTWKDAFRDAVKNILTKTSSKKIDAVCISANGPTLVPLQKDFSSLHPLHWHKKLNSAVSRRTEFAPSLFLPYIQDFMITEPELYEKTKMIISCQEYLMRELGAQAVTVLPTPEYEPYYWNDEQCTVAGIDIKKLPPFVPPGSIAGKISEAAEQLYGIKKNTPLVAGGPDFIMALIGTGTLKEGMVLDRAGSSEGINLCTASPPATPCFRVLPHLQSGLFNVGALIPESGSLFDEYRTKTGQSARDYTDHLNALLCGGAASFLSEENISGRKLLLQMANAVREKTDLFRQNGFTITEMRVSGGQAKNALWNRMKSKITGVRLVVPKLTDGELTGDAILCLKALGLVQTLEEGAEKIVKVYET